MIINIVDPALFNDPIARSTNWEPCNMLGANFCSEKLVRIEPNIMEFRSANGLLAMYSGCIVLGAAILIISKISSIEALLFGLAFILLGAGLILFTSRHAAFDKTTSSLYKKRRKAGQAPDDLNKIYAIQLIAKIIGGRKRYVCCELNLVLKNAERIHIISHGNIKRMRADAQTLSEFLAIPVWDAVES
ncbi:MAG: hypothetical protein VB070_13075 [Clostridiaceae bacterium]|nr:hypothetical protein [Clostridiaceae bacterium]